jgi:hypothetical protein
MTLRPQALPPVPEATVAAARPLRPAGTPSLVTPDGALLREDSPNRVSRGHICHGRLLCRLNRDELC